jgi:hypothetical protein
MAHGTTLLQKKFVRHFVKDLGGGKDFQPPWLITQINQGGHFLLIEAVNRLG